MIKRFLKVIVHLLNVTVEANFSQIYYMYFIYTVPLLFKREFMLNLNFDDLFVKDI